MITLDPSYGSKRHQRFFIRHIDNLESFFKCKKECQDHRLSALLDSNNKIIEPACYTVAQMESSSKFIDEVMKFEGDQ